MGRGREEEVVDGGKGRNRDIELGGVESKWQKERRKEEGGESRRRGRERTVEEGGESKKGRRRSKEGRERKGEGGGPLRGLGVWSLDFAFLIEKLLWEIFPLLQIPWFSFAHFWISLFIALPYPSLFSQFLYLT